MLQIRDQAETIAEMFLKGLMKADWAFYIIGTESNAITFFHKVPR